MADYPKCMVGVTHAGDAFAVRNKRGTTVGGLCAPHERQQRKAIETAGYHLHSWEEMRARGLWSDHEQKEKADRERDTATGAPPRSYPGDYTDVADADFVDDARDDIPDPGDPLPKRRKRVDAGGPQDRKITEHRDSLRAEALDGNLRGGADPDPPRGRDAGVPTTEAVGDHRPQLSSQVPAPSPSGMGTAGGMAPSGGPGNPVPPSSQALSVPAAQLEWWRGASQLAVTTEETEILCRPPDPYDVLVRDRGILYLPWTIQTTSR